MAGRSKLSSPPPKQTNISLKRDRAETDALFASIGEGAIVTDAVGKVSRINQPALDILGMKRKDIVGKWFPDIVIAEDEDGRILPNLERPIAEVFLSGKAVFRKIYYRRPDESRVAVAVTVSPVMLNDKPIGAIELFRDITEEIKLEKARDEFISLASHQLRTPATGVKQYLGMLLDGFAGDLTEDQRQYVEIASNCNDRQIRILNDLLKVAVADSGKMNLKKREVDLIDLIESVIDEQKGNFAAKNQTISFAHASPNIHARIDKEAFRMVIENLIDNAHKYTYPDKNVEVSVEKSDRCVEIAVTDEGTGIDKTDLDKLFRKFSRVDNPLSISSGGSGLGLYWAKQIIDLHGGEIRVTSKLGQGTTFLVCLYE